MFEGNETHDSSSEVEEVPSTREIINMTRHVEIETMERCVFLIEDIP